ncbi:mineralocorticoid receptor isoform X2 [Erpetoichthys calabaricus]|uniref:mineralocorticoid receptor isoform X2 n=1 Tax=Erpetoichthys calabaricus TaxID=27687 RepID=UPI002234D7F2|nr:mineralocorticoid receptor isoform X2 [Erpetoichthys calabaricus]
MEAEMRQGFCEDRGEDRNWSKALDSQEYRASLDREKDETLKEILTAGCAPLPPSDFKQVENQGPVYQTRFLTPDDEPSGKMDATSKELSTAVAESMDLYMNSARDIDYSFAQDTEKTPEEPRLRRDSNLEPSSSPAVTPGGSQHVSALYSTPTVPPSSSLECPVGHTTDPGGTSDSSPMSTFSGPVFTSQCSATGPVNPNFVNVNLGNVHRQNSCSPTSACNTGSPLSSPLSGMRSPISSPQSLCSTSPVSGPLNPRSCVSSPGKHINNMRSSMSSPSSCTTNISVSSPLYFGSDFPMCSPSQGQDVFHNELDGARDREQQDLKEFKLLKIEKSEGELETCRMEQMCMLKMIKNEPATSFAIVAHGNPNKMDSLSALFAVDVKCESSNESSCQNSRYDEQEPPNPFPVSEPTFLSLRERADEYSLSKILGPPTPNGSFEEDAFSDSSLSKRIKQEVVNDAYYGDGHAIHASAIVGINSNELSYYYPTGMQEGLPLSLPDVCNPPSHLLNLISPVTTLMDSWKSRESLLESSHLSRGDIYSAQRCLPESSSTMRSSSSSSSAPAKVCLVCGDEASGCHYGVVTCGSCKVFFKRAIEGQHNYLCAGRNDCIIDKIRRKNCPACRVRKCLQAGMNLGARKSKKLGKLKGIIEDRPLQRVKESQSYLALEKELSSSSALSVHSPSIMPFFTTGLCSILEIIEPEVVYAGYDSTQPETTDYLLSCLNRLAEKQMIRVVKWAKVLPGFRRMPIEDQITLIQLSWMCLSSFALIWRSYLHTNGQMLYFAPDLIFDEMLDLYRAPSSAVVNLMAMGELEVDCEEKKEGKERKFFTEENPRKRMKQSSMYSLCQGIRQVTQEFVRLELTYSEYLSMKVLLLLSTVPIEGLKNQSVFEEMRVTYIKELRQSVFKSTSNSCQMWQRFHQLTKLLDALHDLEALQLDFCFYTFREAQALKVEFPDMLVELISDHIPKVEGGLIRTLYFHRK